jgi:dTDP-glucose 4,6-dehydratase
MRKLNNIMITGNAGFIGANFVYYLLEDLKFKGKVIGVDILTKSSNLNNLNYIASEYGSRNYFFVEKDINDKNGMDNVIKNYDIDTIVHFAAESFVDFSIENPDEFIKTNIVGTYNLLETARNNWKDRKDVLFHFINTDEVFGELKDEGQFYETTPYNPRNVYSASKAAADHLVNAYFHTFGLPVTISNCSNNFGPFQNPEKLIPKVITNIIKKQPIPVYGEGKNIRDWIYAKDHCSAIWKILNEAPDGSRYNVGGDHELTNIDLVKMICKRMDVLLKRETGSSEKLITFVKDRLGHDWRYSINCDKIKNELGWEPKTNFELGLENTMKFYIQDMS